MRIQLTLFKEPVRGFLGTYYIDAIGRNSKKGKDLIIVFDRNEHIVGKKVNYKRIQKIFNITRRLIFV